MGALILGAIGLAMGVWVWQNVHPVLGVVVGFLFVGGAGWNLVGALLSLLRPSARRAYGPEGREFIREWERRFGEIRRGSPRSQPPPRAFQTWLRESKHSGVSASEWIDRQLGLPPRDADHIVHVPLAEDGLGATFAITLKESDRHDVKWWYDEGVEERWESHPLMLSMLVEARLCDVEDSLGLPYTFEHSKDSPLRENKPDPSVE